MAFLAMLIFWLTVQFAGLGLLAPRGRKRARPAIHLSPHAARAIKA
jgi:hypothetical protein